MNGVNGVGAGRGAGHAARMDQSEGAGHSRRPGSGNHPGKHLGQLKQKHKEPLDTATAMPLVQQQLNAVNNGSSNTTKAGNQVGNQASQLDAFATQMIMNDMNQMNANINDQLKFMSRFNAISSAF